MIPWITRKGGCGLPQPQGMNLHSSSGPVGCLGTGGIREISTARLDINRIRCRPGLTGSHYRLSLPFCSRATSTSYKKKITKGNIKGFMVWSTRIEHAKIKKRTKGKTPLVLMRTRGDGNKKKNLAILTGIARLGSKYRNNWGKTK